MFNYLVVLILLSKRLVTLVENAALATIYRQLASLTLINVRDQPSQSKAFQNFLREHSHYGNLTSTVQLYKIRTNIPVSEIIYATFSVWEF